MPDSISISRIKVSVSIGVPDEERATPQTVEISMELIPEYSLFGTEDDIEKTIDYYLVSQEIIKIAQAKSRKLVEQLNEDILKAILQNYPVEQATITTYKYILEQTEHVAIAMTLSKD